MREALKRELRSLIILLPLYQKDVLSTHQQFTVTKKSEDFTRYIHAMTAYTAKQQLVKFITRVLDENPE